MKISKRSQIIVCTVFGLLFSLIIVYYTVPKVPEYLQNLFKTPVPFDSVVSIPPPKSFVSLTTPPPSLPPSLNSLIPQSTPTASTDAIIIINSDPSQEKALYIGVAPVPLQKCSSQVMQYPSILIASILFTDGMEFEINRESPVSVLINTCSNGCGLVQYITNQMYYELSPSMDQNIQQQEKIFATLPDNVTSLSKFFVEDGLTFSNGISISLDNENLGNCIIQGKNGQVVYNVGNFPNIDFPTEITTPSSPPPAIECAANFGTTTACCGQKGSVVAKNYICPSSRPFCSGYVANQNWGTCQPNDNTPLQNFVEYVSRKPFAKKPAQYYNWRFNPYGYSQGTTGFLQTPKASTIKNVDFVLFSNTVSLTTLGKNTLAFEGYQTSIEFSLGDKTTLLSCVNINTNEIWSYTYKNTLNVNQFTSIPQILPMVPMTLSNVKEIILCNSRNPSAPAVLLQVCDFPSTCTNIDTQFLSNPSFCIRSVLSNGSSYSTNENEACRVFYNFNSSLCKYSLHYETAATTYNMLFSSMKGSIQNNQDNPFNYPVTVTSTTGNTVYKMDGLYFSNGCSISLDNSDKGNCIIHTPTMSLELNVSVPSLDIEKQAVTSSTECSENYNYCPSTGVHYCCMNKCDYTATCSTNNGLKYCACSSVSYVRYISQGNSWNFNTSSSIQKFQNATPQAPLFSENYFKELFSSVQFYGQGTSGLQFTSVKGGLKLAGSELNLSIGTIPYELSISSTSNTFSYTVTPTTLPPIAPDQSLGVVPVTNQPYEIDCSANEDFTKTNVPSHSVFVMGNLPGLEDIIITLPYYSNMSTTSNAGGNGTVYYLSNQQSTNGATITFKSPSGMENFSLTLSGGQQATIVIMVQTYVQVM